MATPLNPFWPTISTLYPAASTSSRGNCGSWALISCSTTTSGLACSSHARRFPVRLRTELTFQVAIFIAAGSHAEGVAAAAGRGGVRVVHLERGADHFLDIVELAALEQLQRGAVDQHGRA